MPDVLNVLSGPGEHRPHRDYPDTPAYCAECSARWPCSAHLIELRWQADRVEDERAAEAERW
jgi:hypothetical protein